MSRSRYLEVQEFLQNKKSARINNNFFLHGDQVVSYDTVIAKVDRDNKTVVLDMNKYSKTTSVHQSSVRMGTSCLDGWKLIEVTERF